MKMPRGFHWRVVLVFAVLTALTALGAALSLLGFMPDAPLATQERIGLTLTATGAIAVGLLLVMALVLAYMTRGAFGRVTHSARRIAVGELEHRAGGVRLR